MKSIITFCFACLFCLTGYAQGNDLLELKEKPLVGLLNDFEIVAEMHELPYRVRIIRLRDLGECDGNPQSCPQEIVYIAVSTWEEDPSQKVYVLHKSYGWKFIRWKFLPKKEGREQFIIFEASRKVVSKNLEKGWWSEELYEVHVNPWRGFLERVSK
jgi:hypothetical protein